MGFGIKNITETTTGGIKNNLNATAAPSVNDDSTQGYCVGSVWIYNGVTYTCTDATGTSAKWRSESQTHYSETWGDAVTWMLTGDYAGWYIVIATANGAPDPSVGSFSGTSASRTAASIVSDGGQATIAVTASSVSAFTVKTQPRTVTNPVIKAVYAATTTLAAAFAANGAGYYIWTALPGVKFSGMAVNAVCQCSSAGVWSTFQTYAAAPNSVLVGSGANQYGLFKAGGAWLMTYSLGFGYVCGAGCNLSSGAWVDLTGAADRYVTNNITRMDGYYKFTVARAGYYKVRATPTYNAATGTWFKTRVVVDGFNWYMSPQMYVQTGEAVPQPIEFASQFNAGTVILIQGYAGAAGCTMTGCSMTVEQMQTISIVSI